MTRTSPEVAERLLSEAGLAVCAYLRSAAATVGPLRVEIEDPSGYPDELTVCRDGTLLHASYAGEPTALAVELYALPWSTLSRLVERAMTLGHGTMDPQARLVAPQ